MGAPQKFRRRYIALEVDGNLTEKKLKGVISKLGRELRLFPRPRSVLYDWESGKGLVRCNQLQVDKIREGINRLEDPEIRVRGVSGTIKKARQKFLSS